MLQCIKCRSIVLLSTQRWPNDAEWAGMGERGGDGRAAAINVDSMPARVLLSEMLSFKVHSDIYVVEF